LPEDYNGLGYQNLILIVFKLMSFRDAWMRVGKAGKALSGDTKRSSLIEPLHLVLVEEPEAHLHPQVQQVFVRQAYSVLRNHEDLGDKPTVQTQLIVSTHSSHVAHERPFSSLRYFRRLPSRANADVPTSAVINLSEVFGPNDETEKFVIRYLRAVHCDLFFADAAILVEGPTCHRAVEDRPEVSDSKPATLRRGVHIISGSSIKMFRLRDKTSRGRAASP
jgi:predicted ATP-dependent endonuclease of OLD family